MNTVDDYDIYSLPTIKLYCNNWRYNKLREKEIDTICFIIAIGIILLFSVWCVQFTFFKG